MKTYTIPVNWVKQGLIQVNADNLDEALEKVETVEFAALQPQGTSVPGTTKVTYPVLKEYVTDEFISDKVILYTSSKVPDCGFCKKAKEYFKKNNIDYTEVDIAEDRESLKYVRVRTGSAAIPQIEIGNEVFVGFNEMSIPHALREYGFLEKEEIDVPQTPQPQTQEVQ